MTTSGNLSEYDGGHSPIFKNDKAHGNQYMINESVGYTFYKTGGAGATYGGGVNFSGISLSSNAACEVSVVAPLPPRLIASVAA